MLICDSGLIRGGESSKEKGGGRGGATVKLQGHLLGWGKYGINDNLFSVSQYTLSKMKITRRGPGRISPVTRPLF